MEVTITAKPTEGCILQKLYLNGKKVEASTPYRFNIYEDTVVKAEFVKTEEQLVKEGKAYADSIRLIAKSKPVKTKAGKNVIRVFRYEKNDKKLYFDGYEMEYITVGLQKNTATGQLLHGDVKKRTGSQMTSKRGRFFLRRGAEYNIM